MVLISFSLFLCIINAINDKPLPIYGDGKQIRDWLYVQDHCNAINLVLKREKQETYNIGGGNEKQLEVVNLIGEVLDKNLPKNRISYKNKLLLCKMDSTIEDIHKTRKIQKKLNWKPKENFNSGIIKPFNGTYK